MGRIVKSLKYEVEKNGKGYVHREHRSKKNRKFVRQRNRLMDFKKKLEALKIQELDNENLNYGG